MKIKSPNKIVLFLVAIFLVSGGIYFKFLSSKTTITYKEHVIARGDLEISVQATGSIQPENRLIVKPQIPGRIDQILIEEGQRVKAGQILA